MSRPYNYTCKRCFDKEISASYKSRANHRTHVKKRHNGSLPTFDKLCQENDSRKSKKSETEAATEPTSFEQSNVKKLLNKPIRLTQRDLDLYITKYIVKSVLPFHHISSRGFQNLIKSLVPNLTVKSYKTYSTKSDQLFHSLRCDLKTNLNEVEHVYLTVDHWASYRKGYIGFTVHWYDDKLMRKHACLGLRRIVGSCTFDVLAKVIESVIAEFKLRGKVTH